MACDTARYRVLACHSMSLALGKFILTICLGTRLKLAEDSVSRGHGGQSGSSTDVGKLHDGSEDTVWQSLVAGRGR